MIPGLPEALRLHQSGELVAASAAYRAVLLRDPRNVTALHYLGVLEHQLGHHDVADRLMQQALNFGESSAALYSNLAAAKNGLGQFSDALVWAERASGVDPRLGSAHVNRGVALRGLFRFAEAEQAFRAAVELSPALAEAWSNLGDLLSLRKCFAEAESALRLALELNPLLQDARVNLGVLEARRGNLLAAIEHYDQLLLGDPSAADVRWNRGLCHLALGNYSQGWEDYESRFLDARFPGFHYRGFGPSGLRDPQDLKGRHILLYGEQGLGDAIQFSRFVPLVVRAASSVRLLVHPRLKRLFSCFDGVEIVSAIPKDEGFEAISLMSLPRLFGTTVDTIPFASGYLTAEGELVRQWGAILTQGHRPKVGLVWRGGVSPIMPDRGIPLEELNKALPDGIDYFCLHLDRHEMPSKIRNLPVVQEDFADTAAVLSKLDLVVSVDTSVAHLAGALGKEVWIFLHDIADWRWSQSTHRTPWYQSMRLCRQERADDWQKPIQTIRERLTKLAQEKT
jgi:tetratricopeptide (TPR) repeat protein